MTFLRRSKNSMMNLALRLRYVELIMFMIADNNKVVVCSIPCVNQKQVRLYCFMKISARIQRLAYFVLVKVDCSIPKTPWLCSEYPDSISKALTVFWRPWHYFKGLDTLFQRPWVVSGALTHYTRGLNCIPEGLAVLRESRRYSREFDTFSREPDYVLETLTIFQRPALFQETWHFILEARTVFWKP